MLLRTRILSRWSLSGLGALGLFLLLAGSDPSSGQPPSREQQAAELEKQIEALNKKLNELRRSNGVTAATVVTPDDAYATLPEHRRSRSLYDTGPYYRLFDERIRFYLDSVLDKLEHPPFAAGPALLAAVTRDWSIGTLETLPPHCRAGDNSKAFVGGFRLWEEPYARME